jgi:hypothetical protein
MSLQLVKESVKLEDFFGETLALTGILDHVEGLVSGNERISLKDLPMGEEALREGLTRGLRSKISSETERLQHREISLDLVERSTGALLFGNDVSTTLVEARVDTTNGVFGALNIDKEDRFLETRLASEDGGIDDTTASGDDLSTTTMDGISVKGDIMDIEAASTHVLVTENSFFGGPLEGSSARILDFNHVLDSLGDINKKIGAIVVGTETPDATSIVELPAVFIDEVATTDLGVVARVDLSIFDILGKLLSHGVGLHVDTVVLVGGLGEAHDGRFLGDGFTEGNDGVRHTERDLGELLFQILEANLKMELTSTSDDVFTGFLDGGNDTRIRLAKTLQAFDKLGEIGGVLGLDGDTHDRGDGELHGGNAMGHFGGGQSTRLEEETINTDETAGVTTRDVIDGLDVATHHDDGTLDGLDEEISLLSGLIVGAKDANLLTSLDGTGENTTEGVETTLIGGGDHLGDEEHERTILVTVANSNGALVILRTSVQVVHTVLLGLNG